MTIYTGSVFEVKTKGMAVYTQTVDVCLDHTKGHSKDMIDRHISEASPDELIPNQIEQCITSNSIDIDKNSVIADKVLHVDPYLSMHDKYKAKLGKKTLSSEAIKRIIPTTYATKMVISTNKKGYTVKNPPFGSDYGIEVLAERPAAKYLRDYIEPIDKHNSITIDRLTEKNMLSTPLSKKGREARHLFKTAAQSVFLAIDKLEKNLLDKCKVGLIERIFGSEEYGQKTKAKKIVENAFRNIKKDIETKKHNIIFEINYWKAKLELELIDVLEHELIKVGVIPGPFIEKLLQEIDQTISVDLKNELGYDFEQKQSPKI
ncbi:hypothetical protein GAMM_60158 [Gammaproteobacteria bacterium]